jgi:HD-GYP domain-containing protein (c-di-GMP phosphodiesterase class II)
MIAQQMQLDKDEVERIRYAALLHDIGKINIREDILNKPGKLTDEEFFIMSQHPVYGARIMEPVEEFKEILPYVYHHHERYDKKGYPDGLGGEEIPLASRILAVADSFDAMTSDRPYRNAMSLEKAVDEIKRSKGTQFDPQITELFLGIIDSKSSWLKAVMRSGLTASRPKQEEAPKARPQPSYHDSKSGAEIASVELTHIQSKTGGGSLISRDSNQSSGGTPSSLSKDEPSRPAVPDFPAGRDITDDFDFLGPGGHPPSPEDLR